MQVSPTPVREAIERLQQIGLVTADPILNIRRNNYRIFEMDSIDVEDFFQTRAALESLAAQICATKNWNVDIEALKEYAIQFREGLQRFSTGNVSGDPIAFSKLDRIFHTTLINATGNRFLFESYNSLNKISSYLSIKTSYYVGFQLNRDDALQLGGAARPVATGITKKAFTKTSVFWLLAFLFFCIGFCNLGMQNNMTLALIYQHGFTAVQAANIFSINMFIQIFGKILLGKIYDKAGIKVASIYTLILYVLCTVTMILCTGNITIGLVFGGLFGLMSSATTVAPPYILGSAVGPREYSAIYGVLNLIFVAGCAIGPIVASSVYDKTGTFNVIFIVFTVFAVLSGICTIIAAKKAHDNGFAKMTD